MFAASSASGFPSANFPLDAARTLRDFLAAGATGESFKGRAMPHGWLELL